MLLQYTCQDANILQAFISNLAVMDNHVTLKLIHLPGVWWEQSIKAINREYAIFIEATQFWRCCSNWNIFKHATKSKNVATKSECLYLSALSLLIKDIDINFLKPKCIDLDMGSN
jgi:hypothetical protein